MAVQPLIHERSNSRSFTVDGLNSTVTRHYHITNATESTALNELMSYAPRVAYVTDLDLLVQIPLAVRSPSITPIDGTGKFRGTMRYSYAGREKELLNEEDERLSFDFTSPPAFFSEAKEQNEYGTDARDVGKRINVTAQGEVQGLDFDPGSDTFSVGTILPPNIVTNSWLKARLEQRLTVNQSTFRGLTAGDCLFTGFSGQQRKDDMFEIDFNFAVKVGEQVSDVAGITVGTRVDGFQYIWVMYEPEEDSAADDVIVPKPLGVYVATLFDESNFASFGIDT